MASGFYRCCKLLSESMGYDLLSLFGAEEATIADEVLKEAEAEVLSVVKKLIAVHQQVFSGLTPDEKNELLSASEAECERLSHMRHHRVACPSCGGPATVQGHTIGPEHRSDDGDEIVFKQAVLPNQFACTNCKLKLSGFTSLCAAGLGKQYTRTTRYSAADFYGMIDPSDNDAIESLVREMYYEYDND